MQHKQPKTQRTQHWSVTVERDGENVVKIESNCLSGREISKEDEKVIRDCAHHLLSFIGEGRSDERARCKEIVKRWFGDDIWDAGHECVREIEASDEGYLGNAWERMEKEIGER